MNLIIAHFQIGFVCLQKMLFSFMFLQHSSNKNLLKPNSAILNIGINTVILW